MKLPRSLPNSKHCQEWWKFPLKRENKTSLVIQHVAFRLLKAGCGWHQSVSSLRAFVEYPGKLLTQSPFAAIRAWWPNFDNTTAAFTTRQACLQSLWVLLPSLGYHQPPESNAGLGTLMWGQLKRQSPKNGRPTAYEEPGSCRTTESWIPLPP